MTDAEVANYLDSNRDGRVALAAVDQRTGGIVGVARYVPVAGDRSVVEAAVVVGDEWQQLGIGHRLVDALIAAARQPGTGIEMVFAMTLADNQAIAEMLKRRGFHATRADRGTVDWELRLS